MLATPAAAQMSPPVPPAVIPTQCTGAVHGQFDFWIGNWNVFRTNDAQSLVGTSTVDKIYNGCAIRETWSPFTMLLGGSLNTWDKHRGKWRQIWIDADNSLVDFEGGLADGRMVLTGLWRGLFGAGKDALMRMSYAPLADGSVRQVGETSIDGGKTWQAAFDFTYRRRPDFPHP
jgi:hypothetical protein